VIAAGRLDRPDLAEAVLAAGEADLIAVGRALIADPDWPAKLRDGHADEIRPCIACNACVDLVARAQAARCAVNPEVGRDGRWSLEPAARPRRIMVVGSGPAGMEAARIARLRGHVVSIWERDAALGGKLDAASRAPNKREVLRYRDYQARTLRELGVEIHVGVDVTPELVAAEAPDAVVLATGADAIVAPIPGADGPNVVDALDVLLGHLTVAPGARVVVIGGSATGCETTEFLLGEAGELSILEMLPRVGAGIEQITRRSMLVALRAHGVTIVTGARVTAITAERVEYTTAAGDTSVVAADVVALATGWRPSGAALAARLDGREVVVVGDAAQAADFVAAVNGGADAALAL
jgi:2,4-dienoyl-CoA reductase (NADPH2)